MNCPDCGAQSPGAAKFCIECGSALAAICAACSHRSPAAAKFCMECGAAFAVCAACSHPNPAGAKFCIECGGPLGAAVRPRPEVATSPQLRVVPAAPAPVAAPPRHGLTAPPTPRAEAPPPAAAPESYTPKHLAEKILDSRGALEGERKQVTVLFADVKGSTELIERFDPEEAQTLLDGAVKAMMGAVHRYEGTVNHILGDGIMALFGAPIAHEDHAVRACYAALAMQEAVQSYGDETRQRYGIPVRVRVGLNSGEVVVRAIANDLRMDYSAMGQTVHLAARMEQNASEGGTLLTPATLRLAEGYIEVRSIGPISVKGVAESIEAFELVGAGQVQTRLQASAARGLTRFVGRQAELATLESAFERIAGGEGEVVALVGEPGSGKSRLVWEAAHSPQVGDWLVLETEAIPYGQATPYLPVIQLLKAYCRIESNDDGSAIGEKVQAKLAALGGELEAAGPALLALLDVEVEDPTWHELDPPQRRRRTQEAVAELLLGESQVQPLLLVLENLHWIDTESRALLVSLAERLPAGRLALLVTYRPEYQHDWADKAYFNEVRIDALPREDSGELLGELLGDDPSVQPLKELLVGRTQGNPFFLEESVRSLVETAALVGESGDYRLAQALPSIRVPATVQAVLAARLDRLPPDEKRLLQSAAVVGTDVPLAVLQAVAEVPEEEVLRGLAHLQGADFLHQTSLFPEPEYAFRHALTHAVAYDSLLQQRRRALHSQIVSAIEALYPHRQTEHIERLAQHAFAGEVWDKAAPYYRQAAAKAVARAAYRPAADSLERALLAIEHLPPNPERLGEAADIHLELRSSLLPLHELQSIHDHLREAERLAEKLGDQRRLARTYGYLTSYFSIVRDPDRAVESGQRAVALAAEVGDLALQVPASFFLGESLYTVGEFREGAAVLRQNVVALEGDHRFERFGMTGLPAELSRATLAQCLAELGEFAGASAASGEAVRIAEAANHPYSLVHALNADGFVYLLKGELPRAIRSLERFLELCRTWNLSYPYPLAASRLGYAYVLSGRSAEGLRLLEHGVEQGETRRSFEQAFMVAWLAEAYLLSGRPEQSLEFAQRAFELADESKQRGKQAHVLRIFGQIYAEHGPWRADEAVGRYREALALAEELGMRPLQAHCHLGLGTVHGRSGQLEQARSGLSSAVELYRALQMTSWLPQAEAELQATTLRQADGATEPVASAS